jgi:hypothetical protein
VSTTITSTLAHGITLTSAVYANPVTIAGDIAAATGDGVFAGTAWVIDNIGTILADVGTGVSLKSGGELDNSGTIESQGGYGVASMAGTVDITNSGQIFGASGGVLLSQSIVTLDNEAGGTISGGTTSSEAVKFSGQGPASSTLSNAGLINDQNTGGSGGVGLFLNLASATNSSQGQIDGGQAGVSIGTYADFYNQGTITGQVGVLVAANPVSVTVIDSGTISASGSLAISFLPGQNATHPSLLELLPGAVLDGIANGGSAANVVFGGTTPGVMNSVGHEITSFSTISLSPGAQWEFSGQSALSGQSLVVNNGSLIEMPGDSLTIGSTLAGTGTVDLAGGSLTLGNVVKAGETIDFSATGSVLSFNQSRSFAATIAGFAQGDTIDITGYGSGQTISGTLDGSDFTITGGASELVLDFVAPPSTLAIIPDGIAGGLKTYEMIVPCFVAGTLILTPAGPKRVEDLRRGDLVVTHHGEARPIVWCGHRRVDCDRHAAPEAVLPVLITEGAFAPGIPSRDLYVSPDHALYCENVLIPAKYLINGVSVRQVDRPEVVYHHIELDRHDVIWAETLPAETYLDCGNRHHFARQKGAVSLHPDFQPLRWDRERACAPLVMDGPILVSVRQRLHDRVCDFGGRRVGGTYSVSADGCRLHAIDAENGQLSFRLPPGASVVMIESSSTCAADIDPASVDRRRLGIAITEVMLDGRMVGASDTRFGPGFYEAEQRGRRWFRWTDGSAAFDVTGCCEIAFTIQAVSQVWRMPPLPLPREALRRVLELH